MPCSRCSSSADIASQRSMISGRLWIGRPRLRLLGFGHRHHPQGEDLVDLGRVEECPGAFAGDLGIVVEDDRRAQDSARPRLPRPPAPASSGADDTAAAASRASSGGSITEHERDLRIVRLDDHVGADQRPAQRIVLVSIAIGLGRVVDRRRSAGTDAPIALEPALADGRGTGQRCRTSRPATAHADHETGSMVFAAAGRDAPGSAADQFGRADMVGSLHLDRLVPAEPALRADRSSGTSTNVPP